VIGHPVTDKGRIAFDLVETVSYFGGFKNDATRIVVADRCTGVKCVCWCMFRAFLIQHVPTFILASIVSHASHEIRDIPVYPYPYVDNTLNTIWLGDREPLHNYTSVRMQRKEALINAGYGGVLITEFTVSISE